MSDDVYHPYIILALHKSFCFVFFGANKIKGTLILSYINITCEWHICSVVTVCECKIELFFFYYYLFRRSCTTQAVFTTSH